MDKVRKFTESQLKNQVKIRVGDTVRVHQRIKDGDKERIQVFEGLVIAKKHGDGINGTFTVRKVASGVGVEKVFPLHTPMIEKVEIVKSGKVRRAKIYYIREATGRRGRLKEIKRKEEVKNEEKKEEVSDASKDKKEESDLKSHDKKEDTLKKSEKNEEGVTEKEEDKKTEEKKEDK